MSRVLFFSAICYCFIQMPSVSAQKSQTADISAISYQIGKWLASDIKETKEGRRYQFGYELQWFDQKKSIAKMIISGVFEDGEVRRFWEGYKYWNTDEERILYSGFSKDGRIAKGHLEVKSDNEIKTLYSGKTPNGTKVYIEDTAIEKDDNHYTSVTNMKMEGQDEWRTINTDNWVKVNDQKFNGGLK